MNREEYIDILELENAELKQENKQLKEDIKNIINILDNNCNDLVTTDEEFESLDRWLNEED